MAKLTVTKKHAIEVTALRMELPMRYGDEDVPYDAPLRVGDMWTATVDLDTGKIREWPGGALNLSTKVCDEGRYYLLDEAGREVAAIDGYVPNDVVPGEYGDYVDLEIAADGTITNWPKPDRIDLSAFEED